MRYEISWQDFNSALLRQRFGGQARTRDKVQPQRAAEAKSFFRG
jgi:hypothetical protein